MRKILFIKKNLDMLTEAFIGTKEARNLHASSISHPLTVEAALQKIRTRWPELNSKNDSEPIFIFSTGWRSGSTFLQRIILSSENILIWGEPYRHAALVDTLAQQVKTFTMDWPKDEHFLNSLEDNNLNDKWIANLYPRIEAFLNAHIAFFEELFAKSAVSLNKKRWGFKEVTLGIDHALYLKWLFPKAKFIFLLRNPYHAYSSYRKYRRWYKIWPTEPVFTPKAFGKVWKQLADDFLENHQKVDGIILQYEKLCTSEEKNQLEDYLNMSLVDFSSLHRIGSSNNKFKWIPKVEYFILKREIEPTGSVLGYYY